MWHDTLMSLVVVCVIIALACIWYFTTSDEAADPDGWLGPRYAEKADPGTFSFVPRPDWYFYFLFYLLRIFKWPNTVVIGTVGIPTVLMILLFALPFLDMRRERRLLHRPVAIVTVIIVVLSMGTLTYKGATAEEGGAVAGEQISAKWIADYNLPPEAQPGAKLFAESGCTNCHTYGGIGGSIGPELTSIGAQNRGEDFFVRYISDPSKFGNNVMPKYGGLGQQNLHNLAVFLNDSKGGG
jgi:hypothetical protein